MEEPTADVRDEHFSATKDPTMEFFVSTNWEIRGNGTSLRDAISKIDESKVTERLTVDDIVQSSGVILQPANANVDNRQDTCTIDISSTALRISRIGIVSEGSLLEFFKDSGEYTGTLFAQCTEKYEDATVYLAEFVFDRPTTEASIKFTRIDNSRCDMYLYGIKVVSEDAKPSTNNRQTKDVRGMFEQILRSSCENNKQMPMKLPNLTNIPDYDGNFRTEIEVCLESFMGKQWGGGKTDKPDKPEVKKTVTVEKIKNSTDVMDVEKSSSIERYVDEKLRDMEKRLLRRIDDAETKINDKLDVILKQLESRNNTR